MREIKANFFFLGSEMVQKLNFLSGAICIELTRLFQSALVSVNK